MFKNTYYIRQTDSQEIVKPVSIRSHMEDKNVQKKKLNIRITKSVLIASSQYEMNRTVLFGILLIIALSEVHIRAQSRCTGQPDLTVFIDAVNNARFSYCYQGNEIIAQCLEGLQFDEARRRCIASPNSLQLLPIQPLQ